MRKIKNFILKTITYLNGFCFLFLACAIDSFTDFTFYWVMLGNLAWLFLMAYANGYIYDTKPYFERLEKEGDIYGEL